MVKVVRTPTFRGVEEFTGDFIEKQPLGILNDDVRPHYPKQRKRSKKPETVTIHNAVAVDVGTDVTQ